MAGQPGEEPDAEAVDPEAVAVARGVGLLAAVLVNFGSGRPPEEIIGEAKEYEDFALEVFKDID